MKRKYKFKEGDKVKCIRPKQFSHLAYSDLILNETYTIQESADGFVNIEGFHNFDFDQNRFVKVINYNIIWNNI